MVGTRPHVCLYVLAALCSSAAASFLDSTVLLQARLEVQAGIPYGANEQQMLDNAGREGPADTNRQVLTNVGDIEYVIPIRVGNQNLSAIVDTGSFELTVFSVDCRNCGPAAQYNPTLSLHHKSMDLMTFQSYGSGDANSLLVEDTVKVGSLPEKHQTFWEVTDGRMPILSHASFNAILGMGPPETPAADAWDEVELALESVQEYVEKGAPLPEDVENQTLESMQAAMKVSKYPTLLGNVGVKTFSVCMGAKPGSDGILVWEDTDPFERPDIFTRIPILGRHTWSVTLGDVKLTQPGTFTSRSLACEKSGRDCRALVDSGTSLIAMPADVISKIQSIVSASNMDCKDLTKLPHLVFELGGQLFSLPPDAYIAEATATSAVPETMQSWAMVRKFLVLGPQKQHASSAVCNVVLMESYMQDYAGNPIWIFGMPFFRKYYTAFHLGDNHSSRALYVTEATDDCRPVGGLRSARSEGRSARKIDVSKVHAPKLSLTKQRFTHL